MNERECLQLGIGSRTDVGRVRSDNEDTCRVLPSLSLFIISDGMGGESHGELASAIACDTIARHCSEDPSRTSALYWEVRRPDLSEKTKAGLLEFEHMPDMSEDDVIAHLTQVKGIGVWTAHMFLIFTLRRPDILPVGDYGVQAAIKKHYKKRKLPKPDVMEKIARPWAPYRSVACWYMWRSLDIKTL